MLQKLKERSLDWYIIILSSEVSRIDEVMTRDISMEIGIEKMIRSNRDNLVPLVKIVIISNILIKTIAYVISMKSIAGGARGGTVKKV